ncbi:MAG: hypothetical protein HY720_14505 [Planctomycetes bacterium]|nr:hypothetical protein [Planctomycetota bacterium]
MSASRGCGAFRDEVFLLWADGDALAGKSWASLVEFEEHLRVCETCRTRASRMLRRGLSLKGLGRLEPPADLWEGVAARIEVEARFARAALPKNRAWLRAAALVALSVSLAVLGGLAARRDAGESQERRGRVLVVDSRPTGEEFHYLAEEQGHLLLPREKDENRDAR